MATARDLHFQHVLEVADRIRRAGYRECILPGDFGEHLETGEFCISPVVKLNPFTHNYPRDIDMRMGEHLVHIKLYEMPENSQKAKAILLKIHNSALEAVAQDQADLYIQCLDSYDYVREIKKTTPMLSKVLAEKAKEASDKPRRGGASMITDVLALFDGRVLKAIHNNQFIF